MKIVSSTSQRLVLEDRPGVLAGLVWFMGLICLWAAASGETEGVVETGLVVLMAFGILWLAHVCFPFQRLIFDTATGQFTRVVARLNGRSQTSFALASVERAAVEAQWNDDTRMERLMLIVDGRKEPMEFGFAGAPRGEIVTHVNAWLAKAQGRAHPT